MHIPKIQHAACRLAMDTHSHAEIEAMFAELTSKAEFDDLVIIAGLLIPEEDQA